MTKECFEKQIERLRNAYSNASLSNERIEILWEFFKRIPDSQFQSGVTFLIGEFTTQALPPVTKFQEAVAKYRPVQPLSAANSDQDPRYNCPPCRDFGYGWIGETIVACTCELGQKISPAELAKQQGNYDRGKIIMNTAKKNARAKIAFSCTTPLPYDPNERIG